MIFLLDSTNQVARVLEPKLHERLPDVGLEIFSSFRPLHRRLGKAQENAVVAILTADCRDQLESFKELQTLFVDVRIVLILPDNDPATLALGHKLYPRFLTYREGNMDDLVAVVARIHDKMQAAFHG